MLRGARFLLIGLAAVLAIRVAAQRSPAPAPAPITIDYPLEGSVFPPEITAPTFLWRDPAAAVSWSVDIEFGGGAAGIHAGSAGERLRIGEIDPRAVSDTNKPPALTPKQAEAHTWMPDAATWAAIKKNSVERPATVSITGLAGSPPRPVSRGRVSIRTSKDAVGAPIFYRDVPLMPSDLEKGVIKPLATAAIPLIGWRLRDVGEPRSRLILEGLHTCTNCHSFSRDGKTLGLDVDGPQNDKGTYAIVPVAPQTTIRSEDVITWNSYKGKPAGQSTIGFLSQISPDGRYAVTTLNEEVYVSNFKDYRFLQVFYPTRGILAWYDRESKRMEALPGADDPRYVQTDGSWTPNGQSLVFARAEARDAYPAGRKVAEYAGDPNEIPIQYDLYRIPFNGGRGGPAVPVRGASQNGMSNTFPKVSPDGRWIVFVKCRNGQLMRPDGELWIVPAEGGEARRMRCNTPLMNSWHSFSPNGRWLVFSSKSRSPYTQMFLTHIDEEGNDTPPILIENATAANRAVNLPEFANIPAGGLLHMDAPAAEFYRLFDSALELESAGRHDAAVAEWRKALALDGESAKAHTNLGIALSGTGATEEAIAHFRKAVELDPDYAEAHNNFGVALVQTGKLEEAIAQFRAALRYDPDSARGQSNLGVTLARAGRFAEAIPVLQKVAEANPKAAEIHDTLARALAQERRPEEAMAQWRKAIEGDPGYAEAHHRLGNALYGQGKFAEALAEWRQGLRTDPDNAAVLAQSAWILATCGEASVRNGAEAVKLGEQARDLSGGREPAILDVLAAAYAEAGRFSDAVETARRALSLADGRLAPAVRERLALYEKRNPYRAR